MPLSIEFSQTKLSNLFGQTKQLNIGKNIIRFKSSWFNNRFPGSGNLIDTYHIEAEQDGVETIQTEQQLSSTGFLSYTLT